MVSICLPTESIPSGDVYMPSRVVYSGWWCLDASTCLVMKSIQDAGVYICLATEFIPGGCVYTCFAIKSVPDGGVYMLNQGVCNGWWCLNMLNHGVYTVGAWYIYIHIVVKSTYIPGAWLYHSYEIYTRFWYLYLYMYSQDINKGGIYVFYIDRNSNTTAKYLYLLTVNYYYYYYIYIYICVCVCAGLGYQCILQTYGMHGVWKMSDNFLCISEPSRGLHKSYKLYLYIYYI